MNHYELAILNLRRAEEAVDPADADAYLRLALVHATLAMALQCGAIVGELERVTRVLHARKRAHA
jgi:hypothetical protein